MHRMKRHSKEMRVLANCLRSIHKACDVPRFAEAVAADASEARQAGAQPQAQQEARGLDPL